MVGELNSQLKWNDVPSYAQRSFKGSSAQHIRLESGFRLFVLSKFNTIKSSQGRTYSNFFSPTRPFKGDKGLKHRLDRAEKSGYDRVWFMRECSAYADERAGSRYAVEACLEEPVWGYFGVIRRQGSKGGDTDGFKGYHFYIPGLEFPKMIKRVRAHDLIVK